MLRIFSRHFCLMLLVLVLGVSYAQVSISPIQNTSGVNSVVNNLVSANGGVQISNVTYSGYGLGVGQSGSSVGSFNGSFQGMNAGMVLSTGKVSDIGGANYLEHPGTGFGTPGHALANSVMGTASQDAAVLEFDVKVTGTVFKFDYVFASEEYPEKACNANADRFGIFIRPSDQNSYTRMGPHISMRTTSNGPGILSTDATCFFNDQYYVNNPVAANSTSAITYDGHTTLITTQTDVVPCQTYHVVIVVADGETGFVDSGLLIAAGSMSTNVLDITAGGSLEFCKGGNVVLNAPAGFQYQWKKNNVNISGAVGQTYTASESGNYSVALTNSCGIIYQATALTVNAKPLPSEYLVQVSNNLCTATNNELTLTARQTTGTYLWSTGVTTRSIAVTEPGSYSVELTSEGCVATADTVVIGNTMEVTATIVHEDCKGQRKGTITPHIEGRNGPFTYTWTGTSEYIGSEYPAGYKSALSWLCCLYAGEYTLTVKDEYQCVQTHTYVVTEPEFVGAGLATGRCSATSTPTGGTPPYVITWHKGSTNVQVGTGTSITDLVAATDYKVKVVDSKNCGIPGTYTNFVIEVPSPEYIETNLTTSRGSASVAPTGGTEPYVIKWYKGNVQIGTGLSISNLAAGTDYKVSVTDENCGVPTNFTDVTIATGCSLSLSAVKNAPSCPSSETAYIELTVNGSDPEYELSFLWTGPEGFEPRTEQNLVGVRAGIYSVEVEDESGCKVSQSYELKPGVFTVAGTITNTTCIGLNNGSITTTVAGPSEGEYSVSWSSPDYPSFVSYQKNISNLAAGTYRILVHKHQCDITKDFVVNAPPQELNIQTAVCHQGTSGNALVSTTGGQLPYSYQWMLNGQEMSASNPATGLTAGNYQMTATDNRGCKITQAVEIKSTLSVSAAEGPIKGQAELTIGGGLEPYSISWSNGSTTAAVSALKDDQSYSYTVTDAQGCIATGSLIPESGCDITVSGVITPVGCYGATTGAIDLTIGNCPTCIVSWTGPSGSVGTQTDLDAVPAGSYSAFITEENGCAAAYQGLVTQPSELTAQAVKKDITCFGLNNGEIQIIAAGGTPVTTNVYNTVWKKDGNSFATNGLTKTGLLPGAYEITVTDLKGCSLIVNATVIEPAQFQASVEVENETCMGANNGSVLVENISGGTTPYVYDWTGPNSFVSSLMEIENVPAGTYNLNVRDANGCTVNTSGTVLASSSMLTASIASSSNVTCSGSSNGAIAINASGGTAPYQYQWNRYGAVVSGLTASSYTDLKEGEYEIVVKDAYNCQVPVQQTITEDPIVEVLASNDLICVGDQVVLSASKTGAQYQWIFNGNAYAINTDNTYTVDNINESGYYKVVVYHANGCSEISAPKKITVSNGPTITVTSSPSTHFCEGSSVNLTTQYYPGGVYEWKRGEELFPDQGNTLQSMGQEGTYTVRVQVDGCSSNTASLNLVKHSPFILNDTIGDVGCPGSTTGSVSMSTTGAYGAVTYDWAHIAGTNDGASVLGLDAGEYLVTARDEAGCVVTREILIKGINILVAASQIKPLCNSATQDGGSTSHLGSITLNTLYYTAAGEVCYTGNPSPSVACGTGTVLTGSQSATLESGQTYYIPAGSTATGQLIFNGGTLVVCGTYNGPTSGYFGGGKIVVHSGGWFNIAGNFGITTGAGMSVENYGTLSVFNLSAATGSEYLKNYGVINTTLFSANNSNTPVENYGIINSSQKVTINNSGILNNYCTINTVIVDHLSGTVNNSGTIRLTDIYNFNGTLNLADASLIKTSVMEGKGSITGPSTGMASILACGWAHILPVSSTVATPVTGNVTIGHTPAPCNVNEDYLLTMNPCTVNWSNGQSGNTASNISAGTYTAVLTCGACTKEYLFTLDQPSPVVVNLNTDSVSCFGGNDGKIMAFPSGGTPGMASPYTYVWKKGPDVIGGEASSDLENQTIGSYSVEVRDANSCLATSSTTIEEPEELIVRIQCPSSVSCHDNNDGVLSTNIQGGVAPFTYTWKRDGVVLSTLITGEPTGLIAGEYEVIVTDANGCTANANYTMENPTGSCGGETSCFSAHLTKTDPCPENSNGTITVVTTGAVGPLKYDWTHIPGENNPSYLMGLSAGITYSVKITDMGSAGAIKCFNNRSIVLGTQICPDLPEPCSLQVNTQATSGTCPGASDGSISLTITGAVSGGGLKIDWAHITGDNNPQNITGLAAQTYQVTVWETSKPHCTPITKNVTVFAPGPLTIYSTAAVVCKGNKAVLTSSFPTGNVWTGPGITGSLTTRSIEVELAGQYQVSVSGSCPQTAQVTLAVDEDCVERTFCTPTTITEVVIDDPCSQDLMLMQLIAAKDQYDEYIRDKKEQFREQYREHCVKNATESLTMQYSQTEHHYTLYYYDQAGNLIRTVPPQGVEVITDNTKLTEINEDRRNGLRNEFTTHTLPSTYTYNSLNQLVAQNIPDHDQVNLKNVENLGGGLNGTDLTATAFNGMSGVAIGNNGDDGLIYLSSDGGNTWSPLSTVTTENLNDVVYANNTAYVVGDKGVFLMYNYSESSPKWIVKETAIEGDLVGIGIVPSSGHRVVINRSGEVYTSSDDNEWTKQTSTDLNSMITALSGASLIDIKHDGSDWYAVYGTSSVHHVASSTDGVTWQTGSMFASTLPVKSLHAVNGGNTLVAIAGTNAANVRMQSSDGGANWSVAPVRNADLTSQNIKRTHSTNLNTSVTLTDNGKLVFTNDNQTWTTVTTATTPTGPVAMPLITDMCFGGSIGYAVAGSNEFYKTTNGGLTWTLMSNHNTVPAGYTIKSISNTLDGPLSFGAIATNGSSLHLLLVDIITAQNKVAFTPETVTPITSSITDVVKSSYFYDVNGYTTAYIQTQSGSGNLYALSYSTTNLVYEINNTSLATGIKDFHFTDLNNGYYLAPGALKVTADAGSTWSDVWPVSIPATVEYMAIPNGAANFVLGSSDGKIYRVQSSGISESNVNRGLLKQAAGSGSVAFVTDENGIVYSRTNPGDSWAVKTSVPKLSAQYDLAYSNGILAVAGKDAQRGFIVYSSSDDGYTWSAPADNLDNLANLTNPVATLLIEGSNVWVGTENNKVYQVGSSYSMMSASGSNTLNALAKVQGKILAVGTGGIILEQSGSVLSNETKVKTKKMNALDMVNKQLGFAAGEHGVILKITNDGTSFVELESRTTKELHAVDFVDANNGLAAGENGTITFTRNGGATWKTAQGIDNITFYGVHQVSTTKAVAVASNGAIYYTNNFNVETPVWSKNITLNNSSVTALPDALYAVDFVDPGHGLVGGVATSAGNIYTIDFSGSAPSCTTKTDANDLGGKTIRTIRMADRTIVYAGGDGGLLLVSRSSGNTDTWEELGNVSGDITNISFRDDNSSLMVAGKDQSLYGAVDARYTDRFWYDELGRLVASQNAKQANMKTPEGVSSPGFSYTLYDHLGRIKEVGEAKHTMTPDEFTGAMRNYQRSQVYEAGFLGWLAGASVRREITKTYYDRAIEDLDVEDFTQRELRGRVASITYDQNGDGTYEHATHYTYDVHGNVNTLIQDYAALESSLMANLQTSGIANDQRFKRMDYSYDLLSGNVHEVKFQDGKPDQFFHRYEYDADNRLTHVYTSTDGVLWDRDARYNYYRHGPLARTETGELQVAGTDYFYTLQGWIKGVNANTLYTDRDPGTDGNHNQSGVPGDMNDPASLNKHRQFAADAYGYSLGYYNGDYSSIGSTSALASKTTGMNGQITSLYNGNISHMVTALDMQGDLSKSTQLTAYKYDQLNRIKELKSYMDINIAVANQIDNIDAGYEETFSYDANGNITALTRKGKPTATAPSVQMDNFSYKYEHINGNAQKLRSNRLYHVRDIGPDPIAFTDDIDDQDLVSVYNESDPNSWNYTYDEIGNLKKDSAEGIKEIVWNVYGKVQEVKRIATKTDLEFYYDASGNRVAKVEKPVGSKTIATTWKTTWYVRDATGNIMGTYKQNGVDGPFVLQEQEIYGSSRLGMIERKLPLVTPPAEDRYYTSLRGYRRYEGSNHLGNVLSVISDRKIASVSNGKVRYYKAEVLSYSDYYAFGSSMHGRSSGSYRFGFNGKEKDEETSWQDYGMRLYNPRLARFFSVDPLAKQYPWYSPFQFAGNMAINCIDLDGLEPVEIAFYLAAKCPLPFIGPTEWYTVKGIPDGATYSCAFMWNTKYGETQAYKSIQQRHKWYAYAHKIVNDRGVGNYWFQAAEKVTGWWAVGAADNVNMWFMSDQTEDVMRGANEFLLGENMRNFGPYILGEGPVQWVNKETGFLETFSNLSGAELDNQMVVIEMTSLQGWLDEFKMNYIQKNGEDKWNELHNNINGLFANEFLKNAATSMGADNASSNYAQAEFKKKYGENATFDFMNLEHRVFQGQKMAEYLRNNDDSTQNTETTED